MGSSKLTVVISQAQSKNPSKRHLEENLATSLLLEANLEVSVIPHLYDLTPEHTGMLYLSSISSDMVILAWLYPRAAHWTLDRYGIKGKFGKTELQEEDEEDEFEEENLDEEALDDVTRIGALNVPDRTIYSLDLRHNEHAEIYVDEIRRIAAGLTPSSDKGHANSSRKSTFISSKNLLSKTSEKGTSRSFQAEDLLAPTRRRWYPVIDYDRCTNCLECIDFCLFGVYDVDSLDRISVENQDNCKKGCPACSRVCPEHAIVFPGYKTPAIAGANVGGLTGLKIDLSKLFGGGDSFSIAANERDIELKKDGRQEVGMTVGIPKRQTNRIEDRPKDELDELMDSLDEFDL